MNVIQKFESFYTNLASMKIEELASIYSDNVTFIDPIAAHSGIKTVESYFSKLLENAKYCTFIIHSVQKASDLNTIAGDHIESDKDSKTNFVVNWEMAFTSERINKGRPIKVDGITQLKVVDNKIIYHRDYYDLGQMVYENVPLLGRIIKRIKRTLG